MSAGCSTSSLRTISKDDVENIALGASVLGAGGGGNVESGGLYLKHAIPLYGDVKLITLEELRDDDFVIPLGEMGAPVVGLEKLGVLEHPSQVVKFLGEKIGRKATAVTAVEVGGSNSMVPMVSAVQLGVPMVDADSMGRAFPETQMTSYHLYGLVASPFAVMDERGNKCMIESPDTFWGEKIARTVTSLMGARSIVATFGMDGKTAKAACIGGTITLSEKIGELLNKSHSEENKLESLLTLVNGFVLFKGKIVDVNKTNSRRLQQGRCIVSGRRRILRDDLQNYFSK